MTRKYRTLQDYLQEPPSDTWRFLTHVGRTAGWVIAMFAGVSLLAAWIGLEKIAEPWVLGCVLAVSLIAYAIFSALHKKATQQYKNHYHNLNTIVSQKLMYKYDVEDIEMYPPMNYIDWTRGLKNGVAQVKATKVGSDLPILMSIRMTTEGGLTPIHRNVPVKK